MIIMLFFVIDVYKQVPTAHWDCEDAKKFNVPWINAEIYVIFTT